MLKHIIRKEILGNITSPKFVFSFILCTVLILISFYTGTANYRSELKQYHAAVALNKEDFENQTTIQNMGASGVTITKPPQILSTIAVGIQDAVGRNARVRVGAVDPRLVSSKYDSNPVFAIFGPLDLALIVKIVLSLFAILFTFDAIAGEKELGTLKLTLSNPVPRDQLILGKTIGSFVSLLVPLAVPLLMGLIVLNMFPDISLSAEDWTRLGLVFLCFLLYLSVFFNLGLFISSRTHRSAGSLFILLFVWVVLIFVIPKAAVMVSRQITPVPSVHEVNAEKNTFMQEIQATEGPKMQKAIGEFWEKNAPKDGAPLSPEVQQEFKDMVEEASKTIRAKINTKNAELTADYQTKRRRQQVLALNLSRISPSSAMTLSTLRLSKTGIEEHERFLNSIKTYKPIFRSWFASKRVQSMDMTQRRQPAPPDFGDMPRHEFTPESLSDSLYSVRYDVCIMVLLNIILFVGAFMSFLRYDVR